MAVVGRQTSVWTSASPVHERGFADLGSWVGTENYEMRVDPGGAWIDQQILDRLRDATMNIP